MEQETLYVVIGAVAFIAFCAIALFISVKENDKIKKQNGSLFTRISSLKSEISDLQTESFKRGQKILHLIAENANLKDELKRHIPVKDPITGKFIKKSIKFKKNGNGELVREETYKLPDIADISTHLKLKED